MNAHRRIHGLSAILISSGVSLTTLAHAQSQGGVVLVPEMVVTSRAREETLLDVPISVSLISGDLIDASGITNLEDLGSSVPNFKVTQAPVGEKINIRGIFTSDFVQSLEQSVSTFVDGVNRSRGTQARQEFLDLERIEVLRGPQGTLFGKNTVGGALNLTTRKPTTEFAANLNAGYEFELEETNLAGFVSGPLSDTVRGRLAFAGSDQNEGFIENRFYNDSAPISRTNSVRGILDWDVTSTTLLRLRAEYQDYDFDGQPFALRTAGPLAPLLQPFGVQDGSLTETAIGQAPGGVLDIGSNATLEGDSQEVAVTLEQSFESGASLEIIAAFSALDFQRRTDVDFSPLDLFGVDDTEDYEQASFSVRLLSSDKGRARYVAGLYYQDSDLRITGLSSLNTPVARSILGASCQAAGLSPADAQQLFISATGLNGQTPRNSATQLARAGSAAVVDACVSFGAAQVLPLPLSRVNNLDQESEVIAVYGQTDIDLTSKLQLTLGLRYTVEDKEARQVVFGSDFGSRTPNPSLNPSLATFFETTPHDFGTDLLNRRENKITYVANLQWAVTDQVNAYLSASSGFKAGGFNGIAFGPTPQEAEVDNEELISYELGVKARLLNGAAQLSVAYFLTEFEDLQVAQFAGDTTFIVQNAAEAESQGLELEARFQISKDLSVSVAGALTDFEFTSFPQAACTTQQVQALRQATFNQGTALLGDGNLANDDAGFAAQLFGSLQTIGNCSALGINNLRGRTTDQVPDFTAQLGVDYHLEFGRGFAIDTLAEVAYTDSQFRQTDLDPLTRSGSFAKTNLSVALYRSGMPWTLRLVGRNIFDKNTFSYVNDIPLLDNARTQIVDRPRTIKLQLEYDF
jgi:outer membrane receptor protein involved in Fe transport